MLAAFCHPPATGNHGTHGIVIRDVPVQFGPVQMLTIASGFKLPVQSNCCFILVVEVWSGPVVEFSGLVWSSGC